MTEWVAVPVEPTELGYMSREDVVKALEAISGKGKLSKDLTRLLLSAHHYLISAAPKPDDGPPVIEPERFMLCVQEWVIEAFGDVVAYDVPERNHRFLEESLELVQSLGCTLDEALMLVDYVYGRPAGEPKQEIGGVMVTLAALCAAHGVGMEDAGLTELQRCWQKIDRIREKQHNKPRNSPLPGTAPKPDDELADEVAHWKGLASNQADVMVDMAGLIETTQAEVARLKDDLEVQRIERRRQGDRANSAEAKLRAVGELPRHKMDVIGGDYYPVVDQAHGQWIRASELDALLK